MKYTSKIPCLLLEPFVDYFWSFEFDSTEEQQVQISSFVNSSNGMTFVSKNSSPLQEGIINGLRTIPETFTPICRLEVIGVQFKLGAISQLFGVAAPEFTSQKLGVTHFTHSAFWEMLSQRHNATDKMHVVEAWLVQRSMKAYKQDDLVMDCIRKFNTNENQMSVHALSKSYAISERQLERRFLRTVGVTPINYKRVARFQNALNLLRHAQHLRLTDIAFALGYADQAHFIHEVKQFSGLNPRELRKKITKHAVNQQGSSNFLVDVIPR